MSLTVVGLNPRLLLRATALLDAVGIPASTILYNEFDRDGPRYGPDSTPPVTKFGVGTITPGSGTVNFDLTAITDLIGGGGTIDFTGLKIVLALFVAADDNGAVISIQTGASNGYDLNGGNDLEVTIGGIRYLEYVDELTDVDGTHKILDVVGTDAGDSVDFFLAAW